MLNTLQWGVRQFAELENQMTSVERVLEYSKLPVESTDGAVDQLKDRVRRDAASMEPEETNSLTSVKVDIDVLNSLGWPHEGQIEFKNVSLRYDVLGLPVLKNLSLTIYAGEKIGIIGRTGAGKSSIINCLFHLGYVDGEILIDQVPTNKLALSKLRSKVR